MIARLVSRSLLQVPTSIAGLYPGRLFMSMARGVRSIAERSLGDSTLLVSTELFSRSFTSRISFCKAPLCPLLIKPAGRRFYNGP